MKTHLKFFDSLTLTMIRPLTPPPPVQGVVHLHFGSLDSLPPMVFADPKLAQNALQEAFDELNIAAGQQGSGDDLLKERQIFKMQA